MAQPNIENAFTYLANLQLPHAHLLHPQACNPAMDLVALLSPGGAGAAVKGKSKQRDIGSDTRGWTDTRVSVWRMMSDRAWEVDIKGRPLCLAWSVDGLVLSIIVARPALINRQLAKAIFVDHLSVHDGILIKSVNLQIPSDAVEDLMTRPGWPARAEWTDIGAQWEDVRNGSALCILNGLTDPKPVDPPKPVQLNPFAKPPPPQNPNIPHARLLSFPSLIPSNPPADPHVLSVHLDGRAKHLLTGSFLVSKAADRVLAETRIAQQVLRVAHLSDRLSGLYNTVLRGMDAVEGAWRECAKQNMIWREELEGCASQHGTSRADVHADLFRFLITGRSNEAVSDWMGAKLTGRTLTKWSETLENNLAAVRATVVDSILPALERGIIIFEEIRGWRLSSLHSKDLLLDKDEIDQSLTLLQGLVKLFNRIRLDVEHEALAAQAWVAWLRYETANAGASGIDEHPPAATHDLKLTWSFMKNGFVKSALSLYFPDTLPRPATDLLPAKYVSERTDEPTEPLDELVRQAKARLKPSPTSNASKPHAPANQSAWLEHSDSSSMSVDESNDTMSAIEVEASMEFSMEHMGHVHDPDDDDDDEDDDNDSTTMLNKDAEEEEGEAPRFLELEPWVWMNSLLLASDNVMRNAVPPDKSSNTGSVGASETTRSWLTAAARWLARISDDRSSIILAFATLSEKGKGKENAVQAVKYGAWRGTVVPLAQVGRICAMEVFDELELALVFAEAESCSLVTLEYGLCVDAASEVSGSDPEALLDHVERSSSRAGIPIRRSRRLPLSIPTPLFIRPSNAETRVEMALNGRKGRRTGCIMAPTRREIGVWDMELDEGDGEGDEDEGDGDEDEAME